VTLKTGVMMLNISFDHRNKLHFKIYFMHILIIFHNITVLLYFESK